MGKSMVVTHMGGRTKCLGVQQSKQEKGGEEMKQTNTNARTHRVTGEKAKTETVTVPNTRTEQEAI